MFYAYQNSHVKLQYKIILETLLMNVFTTEPTDIMSNDDESRPVIHQNHMFFYM